MKLPKQNKHSESGYALIIALFFAAVSLLILGGALNWTSNNAIFTERNNSYFTTLSAAEAATEKVIARISSDYQNNGESLVFANLASYRGLVPLPGEHEWWSDFEFSNGAGVSGQTHVSRISSWGYTNLNSQYAGLKGMAAEYRVVSNARHVRSIHGISAGLKQDFQVAAIPIFQFAIFYTMDLEINPGPNMFITGRVHSNSTLYTEPVNTLTYMNHVTAAGEIILHKSPLDPSSRTTGRVRFEGEHDARVSSLTLPIGTNNSPTAVRQVVEIPPAGEDPNSLMGKQRYYNKADLVLIVANNTINARSGAFNNFSTTIPNSQINAFLRTNVSFFDKREGKTVRAVEIDVAKLKRWSETNSILRSQLHRELSSIFVADKRSMPSSSQSGIRLVNGDTLPNLGLTVATPDPLYVKGHYNAAPAHRGTSNTTLTKPASLVADAITILSQAWNDSNSSKPVKNRAATHTTVNAAFLAGIVPSNGHDYSGGVENFPRFLENWDNKTFTYNGSMVVMYYSKKADSPWGSNDVYNAPTRNWAFDVNFMDATKLPPGTPQLLTLIRGSWQPIAPNSLL